MTVPAITCPCKFVCFMSKIYMVCCDYLLEYYNADLLCERH